MKSYRACDNAAVENCMTIVFAENCREAKKIAFSCEVCEDAEFTNVRVQREPEADKLYKGHAEIDWYDAETRLALVRDLGWACLEPYYECETCPAKKYCRKADRQERNESFWAIIGMMSRAPATAPVIRASVK